MKRVSEWLNKERGVIYKIQISKPTSLFWVWNNQEILSLRVTIIFTKFKYTLLIQKAKACCALCCWIYTLMLKVSAKKKDDKCSSVSLSLQQEHLRLQNSSCGCNWGVCLFITSTLSFASIKLFDAAYKLYNFCVVYRSIWCLTTNNKRAKTFCNQCILINWKIGFPITRSVITRIVSFNF